MGSKDNNNFMNKILNNSNKNLIIKTTKVIVNVIVKSIIIWILINKKNNKLIHYKLWKGQILHVKNCL